MPKSPNWLQSKGKPYENAFKKLTGINIDSVCDENNISPESQDLTSLVKKESKKIRQGNHDFFYKIAIKNKLFIPLVSLIFFSFPVKGCKTVNFLNSEEQKYLKVSI